MSISAGKSKDEIYQFLASHSTRNSDLRFQKLVNFCIFSENAV